MSSTFSGTGVALVTPFLANYEIDYSGLDKLVNHCIEGGVNYLVALGTTGETATLSSTEKKNVVAQIIKSAAGRVPIVLGHGGNNTLQLIADLKQIDLTGISAILSVSPYYSKPNQEGIYLHYKMLSEASPLPIILYNVPGRTGMNMTSETTLRIANNFKNVIAIKEASGSVEQCMRIIKNKPAHFEVISGDDNLTLPIIASGGIGVISVVGQAFPKEFSTMVNFATKGDFDFSRKSHYKLFEITEQLFVDGNPGGIKAALKILNICGDTMRPPLAYISSIVLGKLKTLISNIKN